MFACAYSTVSDQLMKSLLSSHPVAQPLKGDSRPPVSMGLSLAPTSSSSVPATSSKLLSSTPIQLRPLNSSRCSCVYSGSGPALGTLAPRPLLSGFYKQQCRHSRATDARSSRQLVCFHLPLGDWREPLWPMRVKTAVSHGGAAGAVCLVTCPI